MLPKDLNIIVREVREIGSKRKVARKYNVTATAINRFLERKGYKLVHRKEWVLEKLDENFN